MEERNGSVLEKDDDDDELDADGRPRKGRAPVTSKKISITPLGELFNTKKEEDKSEDKKPAEPETDKEEKTPEVTEELPVPAPDYFDGYTLNEQSIDLRQLDEMEGELDLSSDRLPVQSGEIDLSDGHVEQPTAEEPEVPHQEMSDEPSRTVTEVSSPPAEEVATDEPLPPAAAEGGGSGHELPPDGPERPPSPEPEPIPEPPSAERVMHPELAQQAEAFDPNTRSEYTPPPTAAAAPERVVERGGGALVAIAVDWFARRRLRKRQAAQEKRLKHIERAQAEAHDQQYRSQIEQGQATRQLQHEMVNRPTLDDIAAERRRHPPTEQLRPSELPSRPVERTPVTSPEKVAVTPEHATNPVAQHAEEEPAVLPPEHHMVHSEWHSIEVDKSGHPVEKPVFEYGQEFKRELHQETRHQDQLATAELVGYSAVNTQFDAGRLPVPVSASTPPLGLPPANQEPQQTTTQSRRPTTTDAVNIALWITLILIILAIVATLVLR